MSNEPFNPSEAGSETEKQISVVDILTLPDLEQDLIAWITRQKSVSLAEVVAYLNQEEDAVTTTLNSLSNQGFVQTLNVDGELRFRTVIPKQRARTSQSLWKNVDF